MADSASSRAALAGQINALRTQLTIAIGRTQLLRRRLAAEPASGRLDGRLATIERALFHLARIADRIEDRS